MHNGQEMLFLSTSSCLHAVAIPSDTMGRYCGVTIGRSPSKIGAVASSAAKGQAVDSKNGKAGMSLKRDEPLRQLAAPTFCLSGLKRYVIQAGPSTRADVSMLSGGRAAQLAASAHADRGGSESLTGTGTGLSLSGEYWTELQDSVLLLQKKVQGGALEGLSIDLVDKYARQVCAIYLS